MDKGEIHCVVCVEEQGRYIRCSASIWMGNYPVCRRAIRVRCWEEPDQARLRPPLEAA